jgi:hypothetical protein
MGWEIDLICISYNGLDRTLLQCLVLFDQLAHWEHGTSWCRKIHTGTYRLVGTRGGIAFQIDVGRERRNGYIHVINEDDIFYCQILPQLLPGHKTWVVA